MDNNNLTIGLSPTQERNSCTHAHVLVKCNRISLDRNIKSLKKQHVWKMSSLETLLHRITKDRLCFSCIQKNEGMMRDIRR